MDITIGELEEIAIAATHCAYCGKPMDWSLGTKGKGANPNSPTLERVNNEKIVCKENILIVCHACNAFKGPLTIKQFHERITGIAKYTAAIVEKMS